MSFHYLSKEQAAEQGQIGYINLAQHPVSFMSSVVGRGMVNVEPGQTISNRQGLLVAWDDDLEKQVVAGLLRRVVPTSPAYKALLAGQKRLDKQKLVQPVPARTSAAKPAQAADLPEGATHGEHGVISYDGKTFGGIQALHAYLDSVGAKA